MMMIKLQKQLTERSSAVTELEGRFLQLQEVSMNMNCLFPTMTCSAVVMTLVSLAFRVSGR